MLKFESVPLIDENYIHGLPLIKQIYTCPKVIYLNYIRHLAQWGNFLPEYKKLDDFRKAICDIVDKLIIMHKESVNVDIYNLEIPKIKDESINNLQKIKLHIINKLNEIYEKNENDLPIEFEKIIMKITYNIEYVEQYCCIPLHCRPPQYFKYYTGGF